MFNAEVTDGMLGTLRDQRERRSLAGRRRRRRLHGLPGDGQARDRDDALPEAGERRSRARQRNRKRQSASLEGGLTPSPERRRIASHRPPAPRACRSTALRGLRPSSIVSASAASCSSCCSSGWSSTSSRTRRLLQRPPDRAHERRRLRPRSRSATRSSTASCS